MEIDTTQYGHKTNVRPVTVNRVLHDEHELEAILGVFQADWFAAGKYVAAFQNELSNFVGGGEFLLTNSGTAALETAIQALLYLGVVRRDDLVLHPACTFNTSAACFTKYGLVPLFVDIDPETYNIDPDLALDAIRRYHPKLAVIPHLLGNMTRLTPILETVPYVVGDSCDTLGSVWDGKEVGSHTLLTAYSFYASHHITAGGVGGALRVNGDTSLVDVCRSLIYWGRDPNAVKGYDVDSFMNRYSYNTLGADAQMTEMQAAFGLAQLAKLPDWNKRRAYTWGMIDTFMEDWESVFILPASYPEAKPSWFGYPLTIRAEAPFTRAALVQKLLDAQIEIRPLFSGNTIKQKAWAHVPYVLGGLTPNADRCLTHSFFLPAWGMDGESLAYLLDTLESAITSLV